MLFFSFVSSLPLNWLFVDMNSYFASVEQELRPELRGLPVGVVPVMAESTCCIAASYEAKAFGVTTGTRVSAAREMCPGIVLVESRPVEYIEMHGKIRAAVDSVLPVHRVDSIDEMSCRLTGRQTEHDRAVALGRKVKDAIREQAGEYLKCSVGIAPNRFLAKVASDMQKPDGFVVIKKEELPERLYPLSLTDFPGIGRRMYARLRANGISTVEELCGLTENRMGRIWESVVGKRWYALLRGEDLAEPETERRSVSHSHVLPPMQRTDEGVRAVFVNLIHKAAFRLRRLGCLTRKMTVGIDYFGEYQSWRKSINVDLKNDTQTMIEAFMSVWNDRPRSRKPLRVSVAFTDLVPAGESTLPLLPAERKRDNVAAALDSINDKFGTNSIYYGSMHAAPDSAPLRISFTSIPDVIKPKKPLRTPGEKK